MNTASAQRQLVDRIFFLSEILGAKVFAGKKRIGKLKDFTIFETGKIPIVTHIYVSRPFGDPSLLIPWDKIESFTTKEIVVAPDDISQYENEPGEREILLRDHVLDKKVIDLEGRDVDVVYDIKMILRNDKLYVTKVDFSWHGLLRRMGLRWLSDFIYDMSAKSKKETISWSYIEPLPQQIGSFKGNVQLKVIKERLADIPPADLADILEELDHEQRIAIFSQLDQEHASDILEEIEPSVQRALVSSLGISKTAKLVREMTTGQAADLLSALPHNEAASIMELLDPEEVKRIQAIMNRQEEQILDYATQDIIILPPDETADRVQETFPKLAKGKDVIMYIYVADSKNKLLGVLDLKELLKADDNSKLEDIMTESVVALNPDSTLHEAYDYFMRYGFRAIPIVDTPGRILGAIPYRDVMNLKHRFWE